MESPVLMPPPSARLIVPPADGMSGSAEAQEVKTDSRSTEVLHLGPGDENFRAAFRPDRATHRTSRSPTALQRVSYTAWSVRVPCGFRNGSVMVPQLEVFVFAVASDVRVFRTLERRVDLARTREEQPWHRPRVARSALRDLP
jgi:hypothetical protein